PAEHLEHGGYLPGRHNQKAASLRVMGILLSNCARGRFIHRNQWISLRRAAHGVSGLPANRLEVVRKGDKAVRKGDRTLDIRRDLPATALLRARLLEKNVNFSVDSPGRRAIIRKWASSWRTIPVKPKTCCTGPGTGTMRRWGSSLACIRIGCGAWCS